MTSRIGTTSVDGTPISHADVARVEAEARLHAEQQRNAVRVVAASSRDVEDCRALLAMLGLDGGTVLEARTQLHGGAKRPRKRRSAA